MSRSCLPEEPTRAEARWIRFPCTPGALVLFLAAAFGLVPLLVSAQSPPPSRSSAGAPSLAPAVPPAPLPPADLVSFANPARAAILNHRLAVRLDPAANKLDALDIFTVARSGGVPTNEPLPFLLWKELRIHGATASTRSGEPVPIVVEALDRMRARSFWERPPYGELDGYENARHHEVRLVDSRFATWPETLLIRIEYNGTIHDTLRPPRAAYSRSFESTAGLIEERGAFLSGSSFWVPSRPGELFTFTLDARVPAGWHAVSQGSPFAHRTKDPAADRSSGRAAGVADSPDGARTDSWFCPHPMEEVYLVAGPWILRERDHGPVRMQTFTYAGTDSALSERYLDGTARYLDLYEGRIGPYPFAKFALVENFWQTGFGMPSFTLLGDRVIRLPFILDTSYGHEILHNWWGNGVFVDPSGGNWCEGLTTYGADYLYKEQEGPDAARQYRLNALAGYLEYVNDGGEIALRDFLGRHDAATQAIGYSKSMMIIHGLRRRVGEERFAEALRAFYSRNLWRRATWSDLLASIEAESPGFDAGTFRRQWIERPGAPRIEVSEPEVTQAGSEWRVRARLRQVMTGVTGRETAASAEFGAPASDARSSPSSGQEPFDLLVPVHLSFEVGDTTWQVPLDAPEREWSVNVRRRPVLLAIDPEFEMMRRIDPSEIPPTLSRVLGSDTVTVVIAAGLSQEMRAACEALAAEWARGQALSIVQEAEMPADWIPETSAWYFGFGPAARRLVAASPEVAWRSEEGEIGSTGRPEEADTGGGWRIAGREYRGTSDVVLVGGFPGRPREAWAVLAIGDPSQVPVIGGKVPHYGKYSFLIFHNGAIDGRGVWSHTDSPLRIPLDSGDARGQGKASRDRG